MVTPFNLSEIQQVCSFDCGENANALLATGKWVLVDVKIIECQRWSEKCGDMEAHLRKGYDTIYILGKVK